MYLFLSLNVGEQDERLCFLYTVGGIASLFFTDAVSGELPFTRIDCRLIFMKTVKILSNLTNEGQVVIGSFHVRT